MEPSRDKWQGSYKRHKSPHFPSKGRNPDFRLNQFFKSSRTLRYPKNRNGFISRKNPQTKRISEAKKISVEDAEEEERRKKLSDTANKLLNKIKTWSAENNEVVEKSEAEKPEPEKSSTETENKHKRIAHSKKTKQVKTKVSVKTKSLRSQKKSSEYEVNKATVKDFQNRIQHKLINEIMQMPKENLQNVLNDPKINPIMEVKMSRLVKENKPLIAQKLRALAEAKMTSNDSSSNPQLLVDIDKLIDPVIETDLSVLPFELIKQMENIFQVQFEYSSGGQTSEEKDMVPEGECSFESEFVNIEEGNEDLRMYECSTDEDEEEIFGKLNLEAPESEFVLTEAEERQVEVNDKESQECNETVVSEKVSVEELPKRKAQRTDRSVKKIKLSVSELANKTTETVESSLPQQPAEQEGGEEAVVEPPTPLDQSVTPSSVQNTSKSVSTQTFIMEPPLLYGLPIPQQSPENSPELLLEEVNVIHKLISKLNERRFKIFLDLLKNNSSSCLNDEFTCDNFVDTFSSGNVYLAESLVEFFRNKQMVGGSRSCLSEDEERQQWKHLKKKRKKEISKKC